MCDIIDNDDDELLYIGFIEYIFLLCWIGCAPRQGQRDHIVLHCSGLALRHSLHV